MKKFSRKWNHFAFSVLTLVACSGNQTAKPEASSEKSSSKGWKRNLLPLRKHPHLRRNHFHQRNLN